MPHLVRALDETDPVGFVGVTLRAEEAEIHRRRMLREERKVDADAIPCRTERIWSARPHASRHELPSVLRRSAWAVAGCRRAETVGPDGERGCWVRQRLRASFRFWNEERAKGPKILQKWCFRTDTAWGLLLVLGGGNIQAREWPSVRESGDVARPSDVKDGNVRGEQHERRREPLPVGGEQA